MDDATQSEWISLLISWFPMIIFFGFFAFFLRRYSLSSKSKYGQMLDRSMQHFDRVEQKLDRIAELLEQKKP